MNTLTDFLGRTIKVGDLVVYPVQDGHRVEMVSALLLEITARGVAVEPQEASRGKKYYGRTRYIDTRTGKGFDPRGATRKEHLSKEVHYRDEATGNVITQEEWWGLRYEDRVFTDYRRVQEVWKDYVKIENVPSKVTLQVTKNIILVESR